MTSCIAPIVIVLVVGGIFFWDQREVARWVREQEAAEAAKLAQRQPIFDRGEFDAVFQLCTDEWREVFSFYNRPSALAWTRGSLDGYFLSGVDGGSWLRLRCTPKGVEKGPRVVRPWLDQLPAEASTEIDTAIEEQWSLALVQLASTPLRDGDLAVELMQDPASGAVVVRRWRGFEDGVEPQVEPPGARSFPDLIASRPFRAAPGKAPPPLAELKRHNWIEKPEAAFAVIEKAMPKGATISELTLNETKIELTIDWPTPSFEDPSPAPFGDMDFDEYGIAGSSWWYPYTEPGFGCPSGRGRPLAEVKAEFYAARKRVTGSRVWWAWYSCSPAYSDEKNGVWHLSSG